MGGQKLDEQSIWALLAYEIPHTIKEFYTVSSEDLTSKNMLWNKIIRTGSSSLKELPIKSNTSIHFKSLLLAAGVQL